MRIALIIRGAQTGAPFSILRPHQQEIATNGCTAVICWRNNVAHPAIKE